MIKDPIIFIRHIMDSIKNINEFSRKLSKDKFMKERMRQNAIIRELEIIGEAVKNTPLNFRKKYPSIEWVKIAGLRDKIIHQYFGVDLEIIWRVVKEDIPELEGEIIKILKKESS